MVCKCSGMALFRHASILAAEMVHINQYVGFQCNLLYIEVHFQMPLHLSGGETHCLEEIGEVLRCQLDWQLSFNLYMTETFIVPQLPVYAHASLFICCSAIHYHLHFPLVVTFVYHQKYRLEQFQSCIL